MRNSMMFSEKVTININTIEDVKKFNKICNLEIFNDADISIYNKRYVVDGKSIMGIFSLNLAEPVEVNISNCGKVEIDAFLSLMRQFQK